MPHQADIEEHKLICEKTFNTIVESKPIFSVGIPAFNEEHRIMKTLLEWTKFLDAHFSKDYEILVVMDGCTDGTPIIVLNFAKKVSSITPLIYPARLGKGGALRKAFEKAQGDFFFFTDADASLPVNEFPKFAEALKEADLAIGCRNWDGSAFKSSLPTHRLVLSRIFNALLRIVFNELREVHDTQCGAKAIRKSAFYTIQDDLFISDLAFDVNLILSALRKGLKLANIYVDWNHFDYASKVSGNYIKIGFAMLLSVLRLRIHYSRFRKLLYSCRLKGLFKLVLNVFS